MEKYSIPLPRFQNLKPQNGGKFLKIRQAKIVINRLKIKYMGRCIYLEKEKRDELRKVFGCTMDTIKRALDGFDKTFLCTSIRHEALMRGGVYYTTITMTYNEETEKWEKKYS
jgi:hypothetical protein